ncbi:MAG: cobalamin-independent methionine synthase II family protein [Solirubrobacteraceae bacterium]
MRSTERILTTHVGSLPRPDDLLQLIWAKAGGEEVDAAVLADLVTASVKDVVQRQRDAGIDIVSDGELSKPGFSSYIYERYTGFDHPLEVTSNALDFTDFPEVAVQLLGERAEKFEHVEMRQCEGPIELKDPEPVQQDIANLAAALGDAPRDSAFLNAPTPGQIVFNNPNKYFASSEEYLGAAAEALRSEYRAIVDAGFNLQLDSPDLAMAAHYFFGDGVGDHMTHVHAAIEALNHALEGLPPERLRLHVCWGNYPGPHNHDVPLRAIIEPALKANVETISFEGANPSHEYEWEIFKDVKLPEDKVLMPGVIDVCNTRLEHPRVVAQRLLRFAQVVGREQVVASTDCGFATFAGVQWLPPSMAWAKLRSLAQGAEIASRELW